MKRVFFSFLVLLMVMSLTATVRVVSYNALNYSDDDPAFRLPSFAAVLNSMDADIIIFQEIDNEAGGELLLSVLNNAGTQFAGAPYINGYDTNNYLVYRTSAVTFAAQDTIQTDLRNINEYEMIIDGNLVRLYGCHLKAGNTDPDEAQRLGEVTRLREHINALEPEAEFLIMGDMNFYTSSESAYQKFIADEADNTSRAEDLSDAVGSWHSNSSFAAVHTQSTRSGTGGNAGGAGGGMDDRFDFIFANYGINEGSSLEYIEDSLTPYGNDGQHYNQSINDGTNAAVPANIANALYNASDHLPVYADFEVIPATEPLLILTIPNIREFWQLNLSYTIKWVSSNFTGNVKIELQNAESGSLTTLTADTANDGEWIWTVSGVQILGDYRIIITAVDNALLTDASNNTFSIVEQHNPDLSIYDIQYTTDPGSDGTYPSPLVDQVITVTGIVTGANFNEDNKFYLSDPEGGAWHGVYVYDYQVGPALGDEVEITAMVQEYYGLTELVQAEALNILSSGNTVPVPIELTCAEFLPTSGSSEAYEGCLLKFSDVTVVQEQDEFGQWYINDGTGTIQVDDGFFKFDEMPVPFVITMGMNFPSIIGCADYSFDEYAINPRFMADLDLSNENDENKITELSFTVTSYPNPFNPETTFSYELREAGNVIINIYNIKGEFVTGLVDEYLAAGNYQTVWNAQEQSSGIYFYKMTNGRFTSTGKMVLMK